MKATRLLASGFALALLLAAPACSDDTEDKVQEATEAVGNEAEEAAIDAREEAEDAVGAAGAQAAANALRVSLKGNDTANDQGIRSVVAINEAAADLPGDPEISGVDDADGDGLDDDGRVQVAVGDQQACVILPAEGDDTQVEAGTC